MEGRGERHGKERKADAVMESVLGVKRILRGPPPRLVVRGKIATEDRDMDGKWERDTADDARVIAERPKCGGD